MPIKEQQCLLAIVKAVIGTSDNYVVRVELPVDSLDERNKIAHSLEQQGYISRLNLMGQNALGCQVEDKSLAYALKYYEKE